MEKRHAWCRVLFGQSYNQSINQPSPGWAINVSRFDDKALLRINQRIYLTFLFLSWRCKQEVGIQTSLRLKNNESLQIIPKKKLQKDICSRRNSLWDECEKCAKKFRFKIQIKQQEDVSLKRKVCKRPAWDDLSRETRASDVIFLFCSQNASVIQQKSYDFMIRLVGWDRRSPPKTKN